MPLPATPHRRRGRRPRPTDDQRPGRIDAHDFRRRARIPNRHRAAGEAAAQAGMAEQVARMLGPAAAIEIGGRRGSAKRCRAGRSERRPCPAPAARHSGCPRRSRPASTSTKLSSAITSRQMSGIGGEKGRHDARQHQPRHAHRHVEPQSMPAGRSRKPLTTSSAASTSPSAGPAAPAARARLGRRHAAGGAVEQPTPRRASSRRTASLSAEALAAAARARFAKAARRATATKAPRSQRSMPLFCFPHKPVLIYGIIAQAYLARLDMRTHLKETP
jgi:hypothetical protein